MKDQNGYRFFPDHVLTELNIWIFLLFLMCVLTIVFPVEMGTKADPLSPPLHVKPEWYFYPMFRWIKMTPEIIGIFVPLVVVLVFVFWPYVARVITRVTGSKTLPLWIGLAGMVFVTLLMLVESMG